jgi:serine/threonine protein kinase
MAAANSDDHNNHRKDNSNSNSNNNNNNNNNNKINNNNNNNSNKNSSPPAHQDDTIGHFKGRAGCVIADRYRLLKEVGMGTFGRVVQCLDLSRQRRVVDHNNYRQQQRQRHDNHDDHPNNNNNNNNNIVAIKIVRNVKRYYESAIIEADIIEDVNRRGRRGRTHCSILYDTFSFHGHYCMVLESLGPSLYDFLKGQKYQPFPIYCVRDFAEQLLETLEYLHSFRLIHTDLKVSKQSYIANISL